MTKVISAIVVVLLAVGAWMWFMRVPATPETATQNGSKVGISWSITELPENPDMPGMPRSGVALISGGKTYDAGQFDGSCSEIDGTSWTLVDGEKTGVICWWAGGGSEIGVFEDGGRLLLKVGVLDEGTAETPGFRGGFETIAEIQ